MANKTTLKDTINTLRESFAEEQKQAQEAFEKKLADLLVNVKKTVVHSLEEAQNAFEGLDKSEQATILNDADIKKVFASFGYVKRKAPDGAGGTRTGGKFGKHKDAILAFLADGEKAQKQLVEKFGVSKQSFAKWGEKLVAMKLVKIEERGRENFWSKV
jgi:hypothetical protein